MTEAGRGKPLNELSNSELLAELGVDVEREATRTLKKREERIIAGFEEIQRFFDEHGRSPGHRGDRDIFERLYATRLDRIRGQEECRGLVEGMDHGGMLTTEAVPFPGPRAGQPTNKALLAELGITVPAAPAEADITRLEHVKSRAEKKAAEEIANRVPCEDFDRFEPLFREVQAGLENGLVEAGLLRDQKDRDYMANIRQGDWFIVNGQKAYVAALGEQRVHGFDKNDYRLRVIYDNRTESDLLLRSLQKALYEDAAARRIVPLSAGPLFDDVAGDEALASGIIYVLRSRSAHPVVAESRDMIHKIGVTRDKVEKRIANARLDPTFLMADVEVVATYELYNIKPVKLENLVHRFFENARLDIEIPDRFGNPVVPREWFLVSLPVIDEAVARIRDGTIADYGYDREKAEVVKVGP